MKLKLDENIGRRGLDLIRAAGHDVMTVRDQDLHGTTDENLFAVCVREQRTLVTLDHDFGHVLRFPPQGTPGVVILETGPRVGARTIIDRLADLVALLKTRSPAGALWIIEPGRLRIRLRGSED